MSFKKYFYKFLLLGFLLICIFCIFYFFISDKRQISESKNLVIDTEALEKFLPVSEGQIVYHKFYTLCYDERHEQASWVYYTPHMKLDGNKVKRTDDFRIDEAVKTGSASPDDYVHSGYDRGHLCPAADMNYSHESMSETFLMSNMSPQKPAFNRGIWKHLEESVRSWAIKEKIWVVTGPILDSLIGSIGMNHVSVPKYFYKVLYSPTTSKMIGFLIPNMKCSGPISDYVVSVDSIERISHIDFFSNLPDSLENILESNSCYSKWSD